MTDLTTTCQRIVRLEEDKQGTRSATLLFEAPGVPVPSTIPPLPTDLPAGSFLALGPDRWCLLGRGDTARAMLYEILVSHKINPLFPADVRREVEAWAKDPQIDDPSLRDLTHLPFVTIDNHDSRDLDQAMCIQPASEGYIVWYALADAAFYVRPGTALFAEALQRGSSYYLPRLGVPMLPPVLSEDLVSLNEGVDRRSMVFKMTLNAACTEVKTEIMRARIRSRAKLTYPGVQAYHDDPEASELKGQDYTQTLDLLGVVGKLRLKEAELRDVVRYDRARIAVSLTGEMVETFGAVREERNDVERWNEQISLLCNGEGASFLREGAGSHPQVQPIYRVHGAPPAQRLEQAQDLINQLIKVHKLDPETWRWNPPHNGDGESVAQYLARLPRNGPHQRIRAAIERQFLLSNQRSGFSGAPGPHFALGVDEYSRFSAPMREVVGIFTHKEAFEKLDPARNQPSPEEDRQTREAVIEAAHASKSLQRNITKKVQKLAIDALLRRDLTQDHAQRPKRTGTVCGLRSSRIYVALDNPPMEIKAYVKHLERALNTTYKLADHNTRLVPSDPTKAPELKVGDALTLVTERYSDKHWVLLPLQKP